MQGFTSVPRHALQLFPVCRTVPIDKIACMPRVCLSNRAGYPRVRAPVGFQSNTRLTYRFEGKFATCIANFQ